MISLPSKGQMAVIFVIALLAVAVAARVPAVRRVVTGAAA